MGKEEFTPSVSEWQIMEVLWTYSTPLTSTEIKENLRDKKAMTLKMVRVLTNRLLQKGLIGYEIDKDDARVYHYYALKTKEECLKEKSQRFIDSYFGGNHTTAFATLLKNYSLTKEQIDELEAILIQSKGDIK